MNIANYQEVMDRHFSGETIVLGPDDVFLRCKFHSCRIVIDMHRGSPGIYDSQLHSCIIEAKRKLMNGRLFGSDYVHCRFKGNFSGVDFGRSPWPNPATKQVDQFGELHDCDFSEATLDLCRFFMIDLGSQKFAPWPQFVIPFNRGLVASQHLDGWPGKFARYLGLLQDEDPALSATSGTLADFQKRYAITEPELLQALDVIGEVIR